MTKLHVYPTTELESLFTSTSKLDSLLHEAEGSLLNPCSEVWSDLISSLRQKNCLSFQIAELTRIEGYDVVQAQQMWGLFSPCRRPAITKWIFTTFDEEHVRLRVGNFLHQFAQKLSISKLSSLNCYILPADPSNTNLMIRNSGISCFAGIPGQIMLQLWPSSGNIERLGPLLARAYLHNLWWSAIEQGEPRLADLLHLEGITNEFIKAIFGRQTDPVRMCFSRPPDATVTLHQIAELYEKQSYSLIQTNLYGSKIEDIPNRLPDVVRLASAELKIAFEAVEAFIDSKDPSIIATCLLGDEIVHDEIVLGIPPYAGLEISQMITKKILRNGTPLVDSIDFSPEKRLQEIKKALLSMRKDFSSSGWTNKGDDNHEH